MKTEDVLRWVERANLSDLQRVAEAIRERAADMNRRADAERPGSA